MADEGTALAEKETESGEELSDAEKLMAKLQEALSVDAQEIGPLRKKLTITIPRTVIDERLGEQFEELKRDAQVPGFRKGRAPIRLIEKRFGHDVGDQLTTQLLGSGYMAAVKKLELKTLGDPLVWVKMPEKTTDAHGMTKTVINEKLVDVETALDQIHMPKEGDFSFSCEVELRPSFELPPLDDIPVQKTARTITGEDLDAEIRRLLAFRSYYAPVENEPVQEDDLLVADVKLVCGETVVKEEANAMLAARDQRYENVQLAGFGDAAVGKRAGDELTLPVTFPEDHDTTEMRGQTGRFDAVIRDIKRMVVPELTPDLLSELGYADESDLKESVRSTLESHLHSAIQDDMRGQVSKYLLQKVECELPAGLSQRQTDRIISRRMIEMYQAGMPEAEIGKRVDELRASAHEEAVADLKLFFILEKIAEDREITVTEDELNGAIAGIAARRNKRFDRVRDELSQNDGLATLHMRLRDAKILDALLDKAAITEKKPAPKSKPKSKGKEKSTRD